MLTSCSLKTLVLKNVVDICSPLGLKLLTLGQILWHYAGRAFQELSHVCFGFILAIIGIALDRSKWRSVISPKISILFLSLTPFDL